MVEEGAGTLVSEVHQHQLYKGQVVPESLKIYIVSHIIDISDINGNE